MIEKEMLWWGRIGDIFGVGGGEVGRLYCWYCHIWLYGHLIFVISYEVFKYGHHTVKLNSDHITLLVGHSG
jgi:hypothetical protein